MISFIISFLFFSKHYFAELKLVKVGANSYQPLNLLAELPLTAFRFAEDNVFRYNQNNLGKYTPITGNVGQLKYFYDALKDADTKRIRIGYYGDSIILGDVISEYVRDYLQEKFGGGGIGFLPIVSQDIKMRQSVLHSFSNDWISASITMRNPNNLPPGISGNVSVPSEGSWVKYQTTNYLPSTEFFYNARIFYSNAGESSVIEYSLNDSRLVKVTLKKGNFINSFLINSNTKSTSLLIKFISGERPYIYGVSLESNSGIYVDNFAMPGNSGVSLLDLNDKMLQNFNQLMNYKLLIFNFGANVTSPNKGVYTVYENKMVEVINKYKRLFPACSIILVSVEDKTMKIGPNFVTNPDVPILLQAQKRIAEKTNIAFWNLWEAMGGENSMYKWVTASPPMALRDYAHFTPQGGQRIADLFVHAILELYKNYKAK